MSLPLPKRAYPAAAPALRWHVVALLACALLTAGAYPLGDRLDHANIVMAYLLVVTLVALLLGRNPAVTASVASVLLFDYFFVDPRFSFAVEDAQYLITFGVMLAVALVIGALTARLREDAETANARAAQTRDLYGLARDVAGALTVESVAMLVGEFTRRHLAAPSALFLPDCAGTLSPVAAPGSPSIDAAVPERVFTQGGALTFVDRHSGDPALALPLVVAGRTRGVLAVTAPEHVAAVASNHRPILEAVATLAGIVVERLHYVDVARDATVAAESERLRNSLLSAVSHDLRTPLTVLVGQADALANARPALPAAQAAVATEIRDEAVRMSQTVHNLLDMARLQSGRVVLRKEWQPLEDVILTSVREVETGLAAKRAVTIDLPHDLPLVEFDAILVERVLINLLDNAARHGSGAIRVGARVQGDAVEVEVGDEGRGIAAGTEAAIFRMFEQGSDGARRGGSGMGLAICKAIVEAHGGRIVARNGAAGGACFAFSLPLGRPPLPAAAETGPLADGAP